MVFKYLLSILGCEQGMILCSRLHPSDIYTKGQGWDDPLRVQVKMGSTPIQM